MRIAVIGIGSIGMVIAARAAQAGCTLELIDASVANVEALNRNGATLCGNLHLNAPVKAYTPDEMSGKYDLVICTTKQTANHAVLTNLLSYLHEDSVVCTLQNGLPEDSVASYVGPERTVGGVVGFGATWLEPGVTAYTSTVEVLEKYAFEIGAVSEDAKRHLPAVKQVLSAVGGTSVIDNLADVRWTKLLMNATFSGMSTVMRDTMLHVLRNPEAMDIIARLADETVKVCHALGHKMVFMQGIDMDLLELLDGETVADKMELYNTVWSKHDIKASMLQDIEKGLRTEVDYINGVVCKCGRETGVPTPFNDKVCEIIKLYENGSTQTAGESLRQLRELL